jgi:hypothetical protein
MNPMERASDTIPPPPDSVPEMCQCVWCGTVVTYDEHRKLLRQRVWTSDGVIFDARECACGGTITVAFERRRAS